jgi:hypothetical protein
MNVQGPSSAISESTDYTNVSSKHSSEPDTRTRHDLTNNAGEWEDEGDAEQIEAGDNLALAIQPLRKWARGEKSTCNKNKPS